MGARAPGMIAVALIAWLCLGAAIGRLVARVLANEIGTPVIASGHPPDVLVGLAWVIGCAFAAALLAAAHQIGSGGPGAGASRR